MDITPEILEQFKDDKAGLIKLIRKMTPKKITEEICSVQPMDGVDLISVAEVLENYQWTRPNCRFGAPYAEEDDK